MTSVPEGVRHQRKMDYEKLQEVVVRLQSQLIDTRDASRRLENQLNCLLMLVRKSWTGDEEASHQVAQVVGVAPPSWSYPTKFNVPDGSESEECSALVEADDSAIWRSEAMQASQMVYFRERLGHLNEVLSKHHNLMQGFDRQTSLHAPRPNSAKKQTKVVRLRRSNSASSLGRAAEFQGDTDIRLKDLIGSQNNLWTEERSRAVVEYLPTKEITVREAMSSARSLMLSGRSSEGDPDRGNRSIFDPCGLVSPAPPTPEPAAQRLGDELRARPKSTTIRHDSGRPLKFETTRPIMPPRPPSSRASSRASSASKPPSGGKRNSSASRRLYPRRPEHVDQFSGEETSMRAMERDLEVNMVALQKKLGIDGNGFVF